MVVNEWYGLDIGDKVKYLNHVGISLSILYKNRGTMRIENGTIIPIACKWVEKLDTTKELELV